MNVELGNSSLSQSNMLMGIDADDPNTVEMGKALFGIADVAAIILDYLSDEEFKNAARAITEFAVCVVKTSKKPFYTLNIFNFEGVAEFIQRFPGIGDNIKALDFHGYHPQVTDANLSTLVELCPNLTHLGFAGSTITSVGLQTITKYAPRLTSLDLTGFYGLDDVGFTSVGKLTQLKILNIKSCYGLTAGGLAPIRALTQLHTLIARKDCNAVAPFSLQQQYLSGLPNLTYLDVYGSPHITDESLSDLPLQLRELNLGGCKKLTGAAIPRLGRLVNLSKLHLCFMQHWLEDADLQKLEQLPSVTQLCLCQSTSPDASVEALATLIQLPSLKSLNLYGISSQPHRELTARFPGRFSLDFDFS